MPVTSALGLRVQGQPELQSQLKLIATLYFKTKQPNNQKPWEVDE